MHAQEAFWDYFWLAKLFLQIAGILPLGGTPSPWKSALNKCLSIAPILYAFYQLLPEINYVLFLSENVDDLLEAVGVSMTVLGGQLRALFVAIHRHEIRRLFAVCKTLWDDTTLADHKVVSLWARRANILSKGYIYSAFFVFISFVTTSTVRQLSIPANSTTRYYPFHYTEDSTPSPQYEIKYTLQTIVACFGLTCAVATDITVTLLVLNICGQFALIRSWLIKISEDEYMTEEENSESPEKMLKKCIRRHQVAMDLYAALEESVNHINLVSIMSGMYMLAISGARLTHSLDSSRFLAPILMGTSGLFFSCWPADRLSQTSSEVAQAAYGVPWYHYSHREKTAVAIMIMRSQRPVTLTAGKFTALTLELFSSIMSSCLSLCMVLYRL